MNYIKYYPQFIDLSNSETSDLKISDLDTYIKITTRIKLKYPLLTIHSKNQFEIIPSDDYIRRYHLGCAEGYG